MSQLVEKTPSPRTRKSLYNDLKELGVKKGMTIIVHTSLSSLGWVNGGAVTVIQALMDAVTEEGTIVMPSQTVEISDPAEWENPPVPEEWWEEIRDTMPLYHPDYTPANFMGKVPEVFRTFPGVERSSHPSYSFTAWGKNKNHILADQPLEWSLGEGSPLGKLYDEGAYVLLLGAGFDSCTAFHLAEYRIGYQDVITKGAPMIEDGKRIWKEYKELEFRDELFEDLGADFEKTQSLSAGHVGSAKSYLFDVKEAVDYAEMWLNLYDRRKSD
ncbi:aminoglycoside N(3)-acetyltransferase [Pontibacillus sp. HMF3514]|uniref:aminoglycoside N(3)-acetyltransferase n=1 Tax=Pontibacillus sp. HMF3514 TaxID=2692425 RepID=UPI0013200A21|nr:AAC(3) family N-acetyltransferase [Pontibacillus sp. HMF3514]QHE53557.1 aminoglycoside N(3)-acetyltransferase [Pontibacillus sp. HMF3514]